jgi:rhodanese-related sulfurtransferase
LHATVTACPRWAYSSYLRPMTESASEAPVQTISREELHAKLERGDRFALFEVLPTMYWRKHHLPGAKSLPPALVEELVPRLVPDKDAEIVLYCWDFT